ncbi:hypothetical protein A9K55_005389 [Cordyceps militaris]|uniref:Uncharacterized protein n=1 Tax=Cordyceps militaris TaxID=73501 RepID=A0A2H4SB93_CORMI|nr:hypothetical protein A9K55_005389 [Cordyceps militaris]
MVNTAAPLSIIIESNTSSTGSWDSKKMHPSPLASHPFRIPTPCFTDLDIPSDLQFTSRPMSALNFGGTRTSYLGGDLHGTFSHGDVIRRRRSRDDVAALIEFLRTHEPPPDNFMSQPYSATGEEERGRWGKLSVMGKRRSKSMSRAPAPLQLPDSAVAGVTTGGHRHIAISIPLNASHFGDDPKSQYPVSNHNIQSTIPPLPEAVRTFKNKNGVVTVLRSFSPSQNHNHLPPSPASPRRFDREYPPQLLRNRRMMPPSPVPSSPDDSEHWPLTQSEPEASSHAQQATTAAYDGTEETRSRIASRQTAEFVRAAYPSRGSSMAAPPRSKHHHASSIDEVIAEEPHNRNPSPMPHDGAVRRNTERRTGHPPVSLNTSPISRKSTSSLRPERPADKQPAAKQPKVTQVTDSPVVSRVRSPSPPASINSVKSRREKVRDKKFRDIAAARSSKLGTLPSPTATEGRNQSITSPTKDHCAPTATAESGPKLSTIMVVVDMHPDDEAVNKDPAATADDDDANSVVEVPPESVTTLPTPPTSTETSPAQKHGFDGTRTSLTRRREWQQQDRNTREASVVAKTTQQPRRPLVAPRAASYAGVTVTDPEREILHLYETYREQRLRDMESRVRRLERNGDLWLRALVPMLEDVHNSRRGIVAATSSLDDATPLRDWASDDGTTANAAGLTPRASHRRHLIRRASLSRERMLEELMRREERDLLDRRYGQPDASGMGSIEPLMRELAAGGARPETSSIRSSNSRPRPPPAPRSVSGSDVPPMPLRPRPVSNRLWV